MVQKIDNLSKIKCDGFWTNFKGSLRDLDMRMLEFENALKSGDGSSKFHFDVIMNFEHHHDGKLYLGCIRDSMQSSSYEIKISLHCFPTLNFYICYDAQHHTDNTKYVDAQLKYIEQVIGETFEKKQECAPVKK